MELHASLAQQLQHASMRYTQAACWIALSISLAATGHSQTFVVVGIPDTQNYSEFYPDIFRQQTQWIVDQQSSRNIRFVSHFGDLVNHGDRLNEWANADLAMRTLDASGIPQGVLAGNHDVTPSGVAGSEFIPANYLSFFGPQRYAHQPWFGGASPTGLSTWQTFNAGGANFLSLSLVVDPPVSELVWAQGVLDTHRDKLVLLTTHRYLQDAEDYTSGVPLVPSGRYPDVWYGVEGVYQPQGVRSEELWDWFVRRNPNIVMVLCGHFHEEFRQTSLNVLGLPVHEMLADYQDDPNGGDGWLRLHTFDLASNRIAVQSYSPYLNQSRVADESNFTLSVTFDSYREVNAVLALQQGIAGYSGTQDTWIDQSNPNNAFGQAGVRISDDDVANSLFSDQRGQALVRFDNLVGSAPGQIPLGTEVLSASLTIQLADDIDTPLYDPRFFVHQVLVPWSEDSTWNSLGNGLSSSELSPGIASFRGDNAPNEDGLRRLDVTSAVRAWVSGAPNHGFAILPEIIAGNDDGIEILTSESGNPLLRPRLEVIYRHAQAAVPFCFGDGTNGACPCGNNSWLGAGAGCTHSLGGAATLRGDGAASLGNDHLTLAAEAMPNSTALFFEGTAGVTAAAFGDGIRCVGGTLRRLGSKTIQNGTARFPEGGEAALSTGIGMPGTERTYQVWFRNAADWCTPATFNLTNAVRVAWTP